MCQKSPDNYDGCCTGFNNRSAPRLNTAKKMRWAARVAELEKVVQRKVARKGADPERRREPTEWPILVHRKRTLGANCRMIRIKAGEDIMASASVKAASIQGLS